MLRGDITNVNLRLRNVENTDMGDLFKWRNHPIIMKNSFNTNSISWDEHNKWYKAKSKDSRSKIYVACYEDEKIGMVRFDEKDDVIKVSVMLNPDFFRQRSRLRSNQIRKR